MFDPATIDPVEEPLDHLTEYYFGITERPAARDFLENRNRLFISFQVSYLDDLIDDDTYTLLIY